MNGPMLDPPAAANRYHEAFVTRVVESFTRVTGRDLAAEVPLDRGALGSSAYFGAFALLCHRGGEDKVLNYGNQFALALWDHDWPSFVTTPSRATAPEQDHAGRDDLMRAVAQNGFAAGYSGRRISRTGRLFLIQDVTVWRLLDEAGRDFGVGAVFRHYRYL